jgi:hypothetical protein
MATTPLMLDIADYLKAQIQAQLKVKRPPKTYAGLPKPTSVLSAPMTRNKTLYNSVNVFWVEDFNEETATPTLVVSFGEAENYAYYIDQGRRPNKPRSKGLGQGVMRPALARWARIKPLPRFRDKKTGRFITDEQRSFMITASVARDGYYGTFFIDKAIKASINKIADDLGEAAEQFLINLLEKQGTIIPI